MWTDAGVSPEGGNTASEREEGRGGGGEACVRACVLGMGGGGIHRSNPLPLPHRSLSEEEALNRPMNK